MTMCRNTDQWPMIFSRKKTEANPHKYTQADIRPQFIRNFAAHPKKKPSATATHTHL